MLKTETVNIDVTVPDGSEFSSAAVIAELNRTTWDVGDEITIPREPVSALLDANGQGSIDLWPNDRGNEQSWYTMTLRVKFSSSNKTKDYHLGFVQPREGAGPFELTDLLTIGLEELGTPSSVIDQPKTGSFYVAENGSDDYNAGKSLAFPFRTVNAALTAAANFGQPAVIIVYPGTHEVQPDSVIPPNCTLYGYDLRSTTLTLPAGQEENNMFLMRNGIKVRGFTFKGLRHEAPPEYTDTAAGLSATSYTDYFVVGTQGYLHDIDNGSSVARAVNYPYPPQKGYVFAFYPGEFITRSPYIADCSSLHSFTQEQMKLPLDREAGNPLMPRGQGNIIADGSVLSGYSPLRSVVVDSFTAINPNGIGYLVQRNAFVQLVSVFTNWSRVGLWAHLGGQFTVANSNTTFGDYSMVASGARRSIRIEDDDIVLTDRDEYPAFADEIDNNFQAIIDASLAEISADPSNGYPYSDQTKNELTARDYGRLLAALSDDLRSGQDRSSQFVIKGWFNWDGERFLPGTPTSGVLADSLQAWDVLEQKILDIACTCAGQPEGNMLNSLISFIKNTVQNPPYEFVRSRIEATGQQLSNSGNGVNYLALPYTQRGTGLSIDPQLTLLEADGGRIYATYSTEAGDTYLGNDLRVDFERGVIEGQAFSRGVQNIALPLIIGLG